MTIFFVGGKRVEEDRPLTVGDTVMVKLPASVHTVEHEYPWAKVIEVLRDNKCIGRLVNRPTYAHGYDKGDELVFEKNPDGHWEVTAPTEGRHNSKNEGSEQ